MAGKIVAAYTFDAGPNAVIYYDEANTEIVAGVIKGALGSLDGWESRDIKAQDSGDLNVRAVKKLRDGLTRVILTQVGEGPIKTDEFLIGANGEPVKK
jgi:diphosphomevalonate decarboxylase